MTRAGRRLHDLLPVGLRAAPDQHPPGGRPRWTTRSSCRARWSASTGTVGERTAERGFAAGYIISNGRLEVDYGGGVSQLATTFFNAAYFAGLEIVEHNPHSFYISRYPEGRESTVAWGVKDVRVPQRLRPRRVHHDQLHQQLGDRADLGHQALPDRVGEGPALRHQALHRRLRPAPGRHERQGDCVAQQGVPGFRVVVTRLFYDGGEQVRSEEFRDALQPGERGPVRQQRAAEAEAASRRRRPRRPGTRPRADAAAAAAERKRPGPELTRRLRSASGPAGAPRSGPAAGPLRSGAAPPTVLPTVLPTEDPAAGALSRSWARGRRRGGG